MSLDNSAAVALVKDLLKTSSEFRAHNLDLAEQFAGRALEICDDLGIDRHQFGEMPVTAIDKPTLTSIEPPADQGPPENPVVRMSPAPQESIDEETRQSSQQLRDLLQQQARVLQNARQAENLETPKAAKRSFRLFGRASEPIFGRLQSATA